MIEYIIATVIISVTIPLLFIRRSSADYNTLKPPKFILFTSIIWVPIVLAASPLAYIQHVNDGGTAIGGIIFLGIFAFPFALLGIYLFLYSLNWKIFLGESELEYTNFIGIKKSYKYSEITEIKTQFRKGTKYVEQYKIYFGKRKISVEYLLVNFDHFEVIIKKRLKRCNNRQAFTKNDKSK